MLPGYACGGGRHHDSALLRNVLRHAGVVAPHTGEPYSEAMLAGLGGGIGFLYAVFEHPGARATMTIVTQHHPEPFLPAALVRTGVPYVVDQTTSSAVAERHLRRTLAAGRAAICAVARQHLPWHGLVEEWDQLAGADPYEVAVVGLSEDGAVTEVDDECVRPNELPTVDFLVAWARHGEGRCRLTAIRGRPPAGHDLESRVRDAVRTTAGHLAGPVLKNPFDVNCGISGIRRLAEQLADPRGRQGWARRYAEPLALFLALRQLHDCLGFEYGAPGGMRPLYAEFLREAAPLLDGPALRRAAELFDRSGELWSRVAEAALPAEVPQLARYADISAQRWELLRTEGSRATGRIVELAREAAALAGSFAAEDPLGPDDRRALLDRLAELVDRCADLEEEAVGVLREAVG